MYKFLKVIHILGVAMFLGSIFAHIATGRVPGAAVSPMVTVAPVVATTRPITPLTLVETRLSLVGSPPVNR